jgi:hypothetical protein
VHLRVVCPAQHRAVCGPEADLPGVSPAWWARQRVEVWSSWADRCAAARRPEERLPVAHHVRNARAYWQVACHPAVLSEQQSAEPSAPDVQVLPLEAAKVAAVRESVQLPAALEPSAQRVAAAVEVGVLLALQPAAVHEEAAAEAVVPHAEVVATAVEVPREEAVAVEAAVRPASRREAEERQAEQEPQAAARPSVAVPSSPSRLRSALARRRAATPPRFARAPRRSPIASPTARWWQAARGEVWS